MKFKKYSKTFRSCAIALTLSMALGISTFSFALENEGQTQNVSVEVKTQDDKEMMNEELNAQVQVIDESQAETAVAEAVKAAKHEKKAITFMHYCDADNNLEPYLLKDLQEAKEGVTNDVNYITLMDRIDGFSNDSAVLGEDFTDTRLYELTPNKATRLSGGDEFPEIRLDSEYEANMGDAKTLAKFISFAKANYPADKYVLILSNHGGGMRDGEDVIDETTHRAICWDETDNNDTLYIGEISDVLTQEHSVDVLGFDACVMGAAEIAYQFRPGNGSFQADVMVASCPNEWGYGWKYDDILKRFDSKGGNNGEEDQTLGGLEKIFKPSEASALDIGAVIVEEQRDSTMPYTNNQQLSCYDLSKAESVKNAVDKLAISLVNKKDAIDSLKGRMTRPSIMHYFNASSNGDRISYPFFDLYDLSSKIAQNPSLFTPEIVNNAKDVMSAVDDLVVYSFGGDKFSGFVDGKNGLSIFLPFGDAKYNRMPHWSYQWWYSPLDTLKELGNDMPYGKLKWCQDNLNPNVNAVGNWFELLDSWYDTSNDSKGGLNGYQW